MPESPPNLSTCLIVFAKPPVEGAVKTRLLPVLSREEATRLYDCFVHDSLDQYLRLGHPVRLYLAEGYIPDSYRRHDRISVHRQRGNDLADRMRAAFLESFAAGYEGAAIIGTDHPTLPDQFLELAFEELAEAEKVVIGPSEDGGYYLLGMNDPYFGLFDEMRYSHSLVFDHTVDRALRTTAELTILPTWYDVDTPEALLRLMLDLQKTPQAAPRTAMFLEELKFRHSFLAKVSAVGD